MFKPCACGIHIRFKPQHFHKCDLKRFREASSLGWAFKGWVERYRVKVRNPKTEFNHPPLVRTMRTRWDLLLSGKWGVFLKDLPDLTLS